MSNKMTELVWEHFKDGGNLKLALVCMADYANDQGVCWPAISKIARRLSCSESQARRTVHQLLDMGIVEVIGNALGGDPGASRRYRILIERLTPPVDGSPTPSTDATRTPSTDASPPADTTPSMDARDPWHGCAPTPSTGDTLTTIEPPLTVNVYTPADFDEAMSAYPERAGGNPRKRALGAWNARIKAGYTAAEMLAGVRRYAAYIRATGAEGTQFVKQAATFFGPDKHFEEPWHLPPPPKEKFNVHKYNREAIARALAEEAAAEQQNERVVGESSLREPWRALQPPQVEK